MENSEISNYDDEGDSNMIIYDNISKADNKQSFPTTVNNNLFSKDSPTGKPVEINNNNIFTRPMNLNISIPNSITADIKILLNE